jgi:hypothetical protein
VTSLAVRFERLDGVPVAVIRRQAKASELSRVVRECCGLVWNELRAQQVKAGRNIAIYWDGSIRLEVGVEVLGSFAERGDVVRSATPPGAAHDAVREWCETNNHSLAGPNWEIYGHWVQEWNSDPSKIRTDVYYQLAG